MNHLISTPDVAKGPLRPRHAYRPTLLVFLAFITLTISLLGYAGNYSWIIDLFSHFRLIYLLLASPIFLMAAFKRDHIATGLAVTSIAINLAAIWPYLPPLNNLQSPQETPVESIRLVSANALYNNPEPELLVDMVDQANPDMLILVEMNAENRANLQQIWDSFPYHLYDEGQKIALLSQIPFESAQYLDHTLGRRHQPEVVVNVNGHPITVIGMHAGTPINHNFWWHRNFELATTADYVSELNTPTIVAGDFNTTAFSNHFSAFVDTSGLVDARRGQGVNGSWPSTLPVGRIPIDQLLASPEIEIVHFSTGAFSGSDHLPIIVDFAIRTADTE